MKTLRHQLLAKLHILIQQQRADKEALYAAYGVTTARDLSDAELSDMVRRLGAIRTTPSTTVSAPTPQRTAPIVNEEIKKKRSEILSLLTKSPQSNDPRKRGLGIPNDWQVLNPWIERHTGALLFKLNADELERFRKQLLMMRTKGWSCREAQTEQPPVPTPAPAPRPSAPKQTVKGAYVLDFSASRVLS